jgi:copper chaperone CopZ
MKSVLLGLIGAGAIGAAGLCELCQSAASASEASRDGRVEAVYAGAVVLDTQTVRLRIEGMTCGGCAISARVVLERLDGVQKAEVKYEEILAIVNYDAKKVTPEQMIKALKEKLRYTASVVEPKGS